MPSLFESFFISILYSWYYYATNKVMIEVILPCLNCILYFVFDVCMYLKVVIIIERPWQPIPYIVQCFTPGPIGLWSILVLYVWNKFGT